MDLEITRVKLQRIATECPWSLWSGLAREALQAMPPDAMAEIDRLRKGLRHAETVMMCVEPRSHKKEYLAALDLIRDVLDNGGSVEMSKRSAVSASESQT